MDMRTGKRNIRVDFTILIALSLIFCTQTQSAADQSSYWVSRAGLYRLSYESSVEPVEINQIHHWILHIETPDGSPVTDAQIVVGGGMPMHNHGLPTHPRMTKSIGQGDYLIEGMRFHMMGQWEVTIEISSKGESDTVVIPLKL